MYFMKNQNKNGAYVLEKERYDVREIIVGVNVFLPPNKTLDLPVYNNIDEFIAFEKLAKYVPPPYTISKLVIRRRVRKEGIEGLFNQILDSNATAKADWNDSSEVLTSDPMFVQMLGVFRTYGVTEEQISRIIAQGTAI